METFEEHYAAMRDAIIKHLPGADMALIDRAVDYANVKHKLQKRKDGSPYIIHPLAVAQIVAEMGLDCDAILGALLHDCIEDTDASHEDIEKIFGQTVAELVEGVTKLTRANFSASEQAAGEKPCYICARMRRGHLYAAAQRRGCNKIALGHHLNDVIETALMSMTYGAQLQGMVPRLRSTNFEGMELIRPLYCVREDDILAWQRYNGLTFLRCACSFSESAAYDAGASKRKETKELIRSLRAVNPNVEINLFASLHKVNLDTLPGYKTNGEMHSFLERL